MNNQIYRLNMNEDARIEFYVADSSELESKKETKELAVTFYSDKNQFDSELNIEDIDYFIEFLKNCRSYILEQNSKD